MFKPMGYFCTDAYICIHLALHQDVITFVPTMTVEKDVEEIGSLEAF